MQRQNRSQWGVTPRAISEFPASSVGLSQSGAPRTDLYSANGLFVKPPHTYQEAAPHVTLPGGPADRCEFSSFITSKTVSGSLRAPKSNGEQLSRAPATTERKKSIVTRELQWTANQPQQEGGLCRLSTQLCDKRRYLQHATCSTVVRSSPQQTHLFAHPLRTYQHQRHQLSPKFSQLEQRHVYTSAASTGFLPGSNALRIFTLNKENNSCSAPTISTMQYTQAGAATSEYWSIPSSHPGLGAVDGNVTAAVKINASLSGVTRSQSPSSRILVAGVAKHLHSTKDASRNRLAEAIASHDCHDSRQCSTDAAVCQNKARHTATVQPAEAERDASKLECTARNNITARLVASTGDAKDYSRDRLAAGAGNNELKSLLKATESGTACSVFDSRTASTAFYAALPDGPPPPLFVAASAHGTKQQLSRVDPLALCRSPFAFPPKESCYVHSENPATLLREIAPGVLSTSRLLALSASASNRGGQFDCAIQRRVYRQARPLGVETSNRRTFIHSIASIHDVRSQKTAFTVHAKLPFQSRSYDRIIRWGALNSEGKTEERKGRERCDTGVLQATSKNTPIVKGLIQACCPESAWTATAGATFSLDVAAVCGGGQKSAAFSSATVKAAQEKKRKMFAANVEQLLAAEKEAAAIIQQAENIRQRLRKRMANDVEEATTAWRAAHEQQLQRTRAKCQETATEVERQVDEETKQKLCCLFDGLEQRKLRTTELVITQVLEVDTSLPLEAVKRFGSAKQQLLFYKNLSQRDEQMVHHPPGDTLSQETDVIVWDQEGHAKVEHFSADSKKKSITQLGSFWVRHQTRGHQHSGRPLVLLSTQTLRGTSFCEGRERGEKPPTSGEESSTFPKLKSLSETFTDRSSHGEDASPQAAQRTQSEKILGKGAEDEEESGKEEGGREQSLLLFEQKKREEATAKSEQTEEVKLHLMEVRGRQKEKSETD